MMTDREVLEGMLEVLSNSDKWTKGAYGKTEDGKTVWGNSPEAVQFCLVGAYQKVTNTQEAGSLINQLLGDQLINKSAQGFNDEPYITYDDIFQLIKERISTIEEE